jgi:hypothetical protein
MKKASTQTPPTTWTKRRLSAMKKWLMIVALAITAYGFLAPTGALAAEAARMDKNELKAGLGNPEVVIIDVRSYTDWFFSGDKIPGAIRENYKDFDGWYAKYPKEKTIVLYCA